MIDLAVPRDIEPQVAELSDIYLYTVDDMREVIEENLRLRASEASKADEIVAAGIEVLRAGLLERQSADVVKIYRDSALALQQVELEKALKMLEKGIEPEEVMAITSSGSIPFSSIFSAFSSSTCCNARAESRYILTTSAD